MKILSYRHRRFSPRCDRATRGQAQVEFALVIVFLMIFILSMFELLLVIHTYSVLADAAKEGVRYAIVHGSRNTTPSPPVGSTSCPCSDIDGPPAPAGTVPGYGSGYGVVLTYAQYSLHDTTGMTVNVTYPDPGTATVPANASPNRVRVGVSYPYSPLFGLSWASVTVYAAAEGRIMN